MARGVGVVAAVACASLGASHRAASSSPPARPMRRRRGSRASTARPGVIEQVAAAGPARLVARLPRGALPAAIDRSSRHILYIAGHPPALWEATIGGGGLTHCRRLVARSRFLRGCVVAELPGASAAHADHDRVGPPGFSTGWAPSTGGCAGRRGGRQASESDRDG